MEKYNGLVETTPGFPQHTYFLDESGRLIAYKKAETFGANSVTRFSKPLSFDRNKRTFDKVWVESV